MHVVTAFQPRLFNTAKNPTRSKQNITNSSIFSRFVDLDVGKIVNVHLFTHRSSSNMCDKMYFLK